MIIIGKIFIQLPLERYLPQIYCILKIFEKRWTPFSTQSLKKVLLTSFTVNEQAARKYLPRFLDSKQTQTAIVCSPNEIESIKYNFNHFNFDLMEIEDLENSILTN